MSKDRFRELVTELCLTVGIPHPQEILRRGQIDVDGYLVDLQFDPGDAEAIYLVYDFGTVSAGRSLQVFRLMLEANCSVYAADQAILGMDGDSGNVTLMVRCPFSEELDGMKLADTLGHYSEHGEYWRKQILAAPEEAYASLMNGRYDWIRM